MRETVYLRIFGNIIKILINQKQQLYKWARENLGEDAVFGGNIAICGDMFLGTNAKVVVHPQYESASLRKRYEKISRVSAHSPLNEIWEIFRDHQVTHIPHYYQACYGSTGAGMPMSHVLEA
eukprot:UN28009